MASLPALQALYLMITESAGFPSLEGGPVTTETAAQAVIGKSYQLLINGEFVAPRTGETAASAAS